MSTERFIAENITVPAGHRALDQAKVDEIAESIKQVGLLHPIIVWCPDPDTLDLVSGAHRLAAVIKLGWEMVSCLVVESDDPLHRELIEIDENLARNDLTVAERTLYTSRRAAVWERLQAGGGISGTSCPTNSAQIRGRGRPNQANLGFAADRLTGRSFRQCCVGCIPMRRWRSRCAIPNRYSASGGRRAWSASRTPPAVMQDF